MLLEFFKVKLSSYSRPIANSCFNNKPIVDACFEQKPLRVFDQKEKPKTEDERRT